MRFRHEIKVKIEMKRRQHTADAVAQEEALAAAAAAAAEEEEEETNDKALPAVAAVFVRPSEALGR